MPVPEIVIMGEQSCGKSSIVEGFVGQRFNFISEGIATKVPLILSLLSDPSFDTPKWELRVDGEWKVLPIDDVKKHVQKENGNSFNFLIFIPYVIYFHRKFSIITILLQQSWQIIK